jgi:hypothetical protein
VGVVASNENTYHPKCFDSQIVFFFLELCLHALCYFLFLFQYIFFSGPAEELKQSRDSMWVANWIS